MVITEILGNINEEVQDSTLKTVEVYFDWFETDKHRIFKESSDGVSFGLQLAVRLKDGDILYKDSQRIYIARVAETALTYIAIDSIKEMGRLCFELGNRHLSLKIEENGVFTLFDQPTYEYLAKQGFKVERLVGKFTDYIECKAHGSSHSHSHDHKH